MFVQSTWQGATSPEEAPNLYYNAQVLNRDPARVVPLVYTDNRSSSVLDNPSDYYVSVIRFSVPTEQLPLFRYDSSVSTPPCPPGGESIITLVYEPTGQEYSAELILVSDAVAYPNEPAVWQVTQYLIMLNRALATAWGLLKAAHPGQPSTAPPIMVFDAPTQLFSLYGQVALRTPGAEVQITCTYPIARLFGALGFTVDLNYIYSGPGTNRFIWVLDDLPGQGFNVVSVNGVDNYKMTQEFPTVAKWNTVKSISFQVFGIPTTPEALSATAGITAPGQAVEAGSDRISFVLTDFEPIAGVADQLAVQYFAAGPLRWYPLVGNMPIRAISIQVLYTDATGIVRPVTIGYGSVFSMKLEFRRRDLNLT